MSMRVAIVLFPNSGSTDYVVTFMDSLRVGPPHDDLLSTGVGFEEKIISLAELGFRRKADTGESGSLFTNRTRDS